MTNQKTPTPAAPAVAESPALPVWTPIVTLDLETASTAAFDEAIEKIEAYAEANPSTGIHLGSVVITSAFGATMVVTPQIAEQCLLNNAGNRKVSLAHIVRFATQMKAGKWHLAQPWLFDDNGKLLDAQHRAWAVYLSGCTITTTVNVVPAVPHLFAFIDSGRGRTAADALFTAGNNGQAPVIAAAISLLFRYEHNALSCMHKQPKLRKLYNDEVLGYAQEHPGIHDAAHLLAGSHGKAVKVINAKGVATAFAYLICQEYDERMLAQFFGPLASGANLNEESPILALRNRLTESGDDEEKLNQAQRLALLIKGFNMWRIGQNPGKKGLYLRDNEKFPRLIGKQLPLAAE